MFYSFGRCRHDSRSKIKDCPEDHAYDVWECWYCKRKLTNIAMEAERVEEWIWGYEEWDYINYITNA